jgi:DNA-binding CsgD family transcriptional regulator
LLASRSQLDDAFGEALRRAQDVLSPFEGARTQLCWGERLRRAGRRVEARRRLHDALAQLEPLGAAPWEEKAARDLRSSGEHTRRASTLGSELTSQESQIAALVAEGRSNKEIAASLFLSPKTVVFPLGRIYRKLDVKSRTQLARALLLPLASTTASTGEAIVRALPG